MNANDLKWQCDEKKARHDLSLLPDGRTEGSNFVLLSFDLVAWSARQKVESLQVTGGEDSTQEKSAEYMQGVLACHAFSIDALSFFLHLGNHISNLYECKWYQ